jgi:hypothetical protein
MFISAMSLGNALFIAVVFLSSTLNVFRAELFNIEYTHDIVSILLTMIISAFIFYSVQSTWLIWMLGMLGMLLSTWLLRLIDNICITFSTLIMLFITAAFCYFIWLHPKQFIFVTASLVATLIISCFYVATAWFILKFTISKQYKKLLCISKALLMYILCFIFVAVCTGILFDLIGSIVLAAKNIPNLDTTKSIFSPAGYTTITILCFIPINIFIISKLNKRLSSDVLT